MTFGQNFEQSKTGRYFTPETTAGFLSAVGSLPTCGGKVKYLNVPASFDIETTSVLLPDNTPAGIMYCFSFCLNGACFFGRTYDDLTKLISAITAHYHISMTRRLRVYVRNLGFEFQFIRKHFEWREIYARQTRTPMSALTAGGQVVVSRGELVEIGGSFRVPDIMEACGAQLKEVGTTNKTHLRDYDRAICAETKALMKVHTSNYRIVGFTETPALADLVELGHSRDMLVIEDLGSGCLVDLNQFGIHGEPTVLDSLRAGVDVVSISGDKLLGGPQAGIILGKKKYIDVLKKHPLTRAMRVDKMTLAALEATLRSYEAEKAHKEIPTIAMLAVSQEELKSRAEVLCAGLVQAGCNAEVVATEGQVGGGSVPTQMLKSFAVALTPKNGSVDAMEEKFRLGEPAIIGRINHDRYLLDVRTLKDSDFEEIIHAATEAEV